MDSCVVLHDPASTALLGAALCTLLGLGVGVGKSPPEGWHSRPGIHWLLLCQRGHSGTQACLDLGRKVSVDTETTQVSSAPVAFVKLEPGRTLG